VTPFGSPTWQLLSLGYKDPGQTNSTAARQRK